MVPLWPEQLWKALATAETDHLTYEQLEAYADSRLDPTEAELVRAHADLCAQCASELADLSDFATELSAKVFSSPAEAARTSLWQRGVDWFSLPRHSWTAVAAAAAVLVVVVVLGRTPPSAGPGGDSPTRASNRPIEAVLPSAALVGTSPEPTATAVRPYRVLTQEEVAAYRRDLAAAPSDPAARAAVALKYSLFGEAEREYRKLEAAGGKDAAEARRLLQQLQQLRGQ